MEIKKSVFLIAFLITIILLLSLLVIGSMMNEGRKKYVDEQMQIISSMSDINIYILMSDVYGDEMACLAFESKLKDWDKTLWDLGIKLERYRVATEEFQKDPFYLENKKLFNENQLLYMLFLKRMKEDCDLEKSIVSFFFKDSKECDKCDDQSFILTDIKMRADEDVSIFAYDLDLDLSNVRLLADYYDVEDYQLPCVVVDENVFCGIRSRQFLTEKICEFNPGLDFCS